MTYSEFVHKKILGVPVLYIAGAAVIILAIVAWRMKPASTTDTEGVDPEASMPSDDPTGNDLAGVADAYGGYTTNGTVVVQPTAPVAADPVEETNDTWLTAAVDYIVNDAKLATPGEAQSALTKYLNGEDLSFAEGAIRDAAIKKLKTPPEPLGKIGITATAPAQRQFGTFPGKHTVKGPNDNSFMKLAGLYYGSADWTHANFISSKNPTLGPPATPLSVGTVVSIPAYTAPRMFTVTKDTLTFAKVAAKNGTTAQAVQYLNPTWSEPFKVGSQIRVA